MKLSTKGRYAVMAMVDLAKYSRGQPVALADIAIRQEISLSYLEQLFAKLRRAGVVRSVRGPGGGYVLAFPPRDTRISDIIIAVDRSPATLEALRGFEARVARGGSGRLIIQRGPYQLVLSF